MEENDGEDTILEPAFSICTKDLGNYGENSGDFPVNGHQYLLMVMKEAIAVPEIVVADIDRQKFAAKQTVYVPQGEIYEIPDQFLPSETWQKYQLEDFERIRETVDVLREKLRETDVKVSEDKNWEAWQTFWKSKPEPTLKLMLSYNQNSLDKTLTSFRHLIDENTEQFDGHMGLWVYAILACLEIPLSPSIFSSLRFIAEAAIKRRSEIVTNLGEGEEVNISYLNLIICLVGRYFKQADLADKFTIK